MIDLQVVTAHGRLATRQGRVVVGRRVELHDAGVHRLGLEGDGGDEQQRASREQARRVREGSGLVSGRHHGARVQQDTKGNVRPQGLASRVGEGQEACLAGRGRVVGESPAGRPIAAGWHGRESQARFRVLPRITILWSLVARPNPMVPTGRLNGWATPVSGDRTGLGGRRLGADLRSGADLKVCATSLSGARSAQSL